MNVLTFLKNDALYWIGCMIGVAVSVLCGRVGMFPEGFLASVSIMVCFFYLDIKAMHRRFARKAAARDAYYRLTGRRLTE